jgi:MFS family permease
MPTRADDTSGPPSLHSLTRKRTTVSFTVRVRTLGAPLRSSAFRRIWGAQVLSDLGDYAGKVALAMLVFSHTRSAALATLTLAITFVPWLGPGQLLAAFCERYPRRTVLVACDVVRALLYLALCLPIPLPGLWVLAFAAGLAVPPFTAARSAALTELLTTEERIPAYRLCGITAEAAIVLGGFAGALLLAAVGPVGALVADAASFAVSAVLLSGLPALRAPGTVTARVGVVDHLRRSAEPLWSDPVTRRAALLGTLAVASGTAVETLAAPHAAQAFPGASWVAGLVLAGMAGLSMLVTVQVPDVEDPHTLMRFSALVTVAPAAVAGLLLFSRDAVPVTIGFVLVGGLFATFVPTQVVMASRLPAVRRATSFSVLMGVMAFEQAVLSSAAGSLADRLGTGPAAALVCLPTVVVAVGVLLTPARDVDGDIASGEVGSLVEESATGDARG